MTPMEHKPGKLTGIEAIVFDLDGTLWDASAATVTAWNSVIEKLKIPRELLQRKDIISVTGRPFDECVAILFPDIDEAARKELGKALNEEERAVIGKLGGELFPGVERGLSQLALQYQLFIVSNCQDWYLQNFFKHYNFPGYFHGWDCHGMSGTSKAAMLQDIKASYIIEDLAYVGDTAQDQQAAEDTDIPFIHASYGFGVGITATRTIGSFPEIHSFFS